ncbi:GNAT family N-acetyltransferase [Adhaeribacter rhizoryzae]|uniref:GNAT family N-acetyltransferase n=1 Tax=Adhaeribacter rhizoryzae TaxID=2607907 RepID=A0A5M6CZT8_9BACT|nr:GNAT family N-acetyltransferase [Adhaeribacter rhizoryzae]KAA5540366.1 GNAT family N-acetyltransferase [Adhaeribacter rhizoryzae]
MNISVTIRVATSQDNIVLAQLGQETFAQAFAAANTPEDMAAYLPGTFSPALQAAELADPQNIFWLVYAGSELAGYVKMNTGPAAACITATKALKIARLYLLQHWHGRGIGSEILNQCFCYARAAGFGAVWLTVWEHNLGALTLYQRLGFKIIGHEDFVLGQDVQHDYIMEKVII